MGESGSIIMLILRTCGSQSSPSNPVVFSLGGGSWEPPGSQNVFGDWPNGMAPGLGPGGSRFESAVPDHEKNLLLSDIFSLLLNNL